MKDKIIFLVIGILIGAIITAGCFMVFSKNNNSSQGRMKDGEPPSGNFMQERGERGDKTEQMPMDNMATSSSNSL